MLSTAPLATALADLVAARPRVAAFVAAGTTAATGAGNRAAAAGAGDLAARFAGATRAVGRAALVLDDAERARWPWPPCATEAALARIALLAAPGTTIDEADAAALFRAGDNDERVAILRALPLLPDPARFLDLAVDACRTNVVSIFEAIACDNPYPAAHFPDLNFNQLALKTVFLGLPLARILGLGDRRTPELARMADDYAAERRAAGRPVPADLTLIGSRA
jgi:hypothetical protein